MITRVILNGCNGKMGQMISRLGEIDDNIKIVAGIDYYNTEELFDYPVFQTPEECTCVADAIIDFSNSEALPVIVNFSLRNRIPLVVATTGLSAKQQQLLENLSKDVPVLVSANMSLGVNLLIDLVQKAAKVLEDNFDIEIIEKHHNTKVDAPSGTALMLADAINQALEQQKEYIYERQSKRQKRDKSELGIHAVRGGTIVGEHSVIFAGPHEVVEINHKAYSREIFANGALKAAQFLSDMKPGLYSMKDLIGN